MIGSEVKGLLQNKHTLVEFSRKNGQDITKKEDCENAMKNVDIVIHAAAELDEANGKEGMWKTNVEGTRNLLEAAEKKDIKQFIFLSSVGVYGDSLDVLSEKNPMNPLTTYERSKKTGEELVLGYQEVFPVTIIRPAIVVGPNRYWAKIFKTIRKGFPLIGKGENGWQMVHVEDVARFIVSCVGNEDTYNEDFIVAENEKHTLREVVDMIAEIQGVKKVGSMPAFLGIAASYVFALQGKLTGTKPLLIPSHVKRLLKNREYDTTKARATGWKPKLSTREALEKTYHELKENNHLN